MKTQDRSEEAPTEEAGSPERLSNHHENAEDGEGSDSDGSPVPGDGDENGYVLVRSADVRKQVECPICLGIIRKTRTVMECLHRFCRVCIDKSMRMGNNECPACRTHCASRRSLRDDPHFDALIALLYPDIDKFEEEEFAFGEEEKARNKQVQASIAQVRQSQTSGKRRARATDTAATFVRKSQRKYLKLGGQPNPQDTDPLGSYDEDIDGRYDPKVLPSPDDSGAELRPKKCMRLGAARFSQPSSAPTNVNGGASLRPVSSPDGFSWGKGGLRSQTRHGNSIGGRNPENSRISRLINSLRNSEESDDRVSSLMLVSLGEQNTDNLQCPYLSCSSAAMPVRNLQQYVALHTSSHPEEIEMFFVEPNGNTSFTGAKLTNSNAADIELRALKEHDTLEGHRPMTNFSRSHLLVGYQQGPAGNTQ